MSATTLAKINRLESECGSLYVNGTKYILIDKMKPIKVRGITAAFEAPAVRINDISRAVTDIKGRLCVPVNKLILQRYNFDIDFNAV